MQNFLFQSCPRIVSEAGGLQRLADFCRQLGMKRPFIVTDPGLAQLGLLQNVHQALNDGGLPHASYSEVEADPAEHIVEAALAAANAWGADGIIGFGGGSSMDTAKLVALMAGGGEPLSALYGVDQAKGQRLPLVLIPTTAGTGSEVTAVAIVTTGATTKMGVVAPQLFGDLALLDAELTLGLPPAITAMTGIDAMVHAIEAYTSAIKKNPYSDMLAREALRLLANNIETATHRGDDRDARQAMLLGACLAGQAFANAPVAAVHALAYPLGGHYHLPHGLSNSLMLPHVLRFNAAEAAPLYAELAELQVDPQRLSGDSESRCAQFISDIEQLIARLQLPTKLAKLDVPEADLPMLASDAMLQQRLLVNNPRPVSEADALALYRAAYA